MQTNDNNPQKQIRMKTIVLGLALTSMCSTTYAQTSQTGDELVFTTIRQNPITPVKNQNRSGTCWDYATLGFVESELLRTKGKTFDLSEMFVANKDYMDCAEYHVRMHGHSRFSEGGSADDVFAVISRHGICPETAMAHPGELIGDTLADFTEFFSALEPYVQSIAKSTSKQLTTQWRTGMQGILDAYLGKCPETFVFEGKEYTPLSFAQMLGIKKDNYVSITSFTHHPFYEPFVIEAPYKWRPCLSQNVPMDEMMSVIDNALEKGYTVAWGGDVSEDGFTRQGLALACDPEKVQDLTGSDAARWLQLTRQERASAIKKLGVRTPEITPTQALRQERFDLWQSTYDHVMLIYGLAHDQNGREYYMVKNSWGDTGDYHGIWYMSKNYIALNTTYIFLHKDAVSPAIRKKLKIQ